MAVFLTSKQWGRAKVKLPKNVRIAKAKKRTRVARPGVMGLVGAKPAKERKGRR